MNNLSIKNNFTNMYRTPPNTVGSQPNQAMKLPQSQTALTPSKSNVKVDPIPLSTGDILMCVGGIAAATSSALDHLGYSTSLLSTIGKITTVALILGELYTVTGKIQGDAVKALEKKEESFFTIEQLQFKAKYGIIEASTTVGIKWLGLALLKRAYEPEYQSAAFFMSAIAASYTVPRAIQELQKTFQAANLKEHTWEIARNTFVHGFNASYSLYNVGNLFYGLFRPTQAPLFPSDKETDPQMPPALTIPSTLDGKSKCQLAEEIASKLGPMSVKQQEQQVNYLIKAFTKNDNQKKAIRDISLILHPDKNPTCSNAATFAQKIFNDAAERIQSSPSAIEHYTHHREARRIAEIPNPIYEDSSLEEKTNFSCEVFKGVCDTLSKAISDSKSKLTNLIMDYRNGKLEKEEVQDSIYTTLQRLQDQIVSTINRRILDVIDHINDQKDSAFDHYFGKTPLPIAKAQAAHYLNQASMHLIDTFSWEHATKDLDFESYGLDTKFFVDPNDA